MEDESSGRLLSDYFASRASTFPASMGEYRLALPTASDFVPPRGVFLLVEHEGADVGCGGIRLVPTAAGVTRFEVKHLWTDPSVRGRGLGRLLLQELEARAVAFGASELVLDTNATQVAASNLYRASGYAEIPPYNDNPNATHWFAKNLATGLE